jgi:acetyl-CoA carboxylase carboxyltransferase component
MPYEEKIAEFEHKRSKALGMGGEDKLRKQTERGALNARERLEYLIDEGSFLESGLFATSYRREVRDKTPTDGIVAGIGRISGRKVAIFVSDYTIMAASNSRVGAQKQDILTKTATRNGIPIVFLAENAGARMPDAMGAEGIAGLGPSISYKRFRETPWASAVLGPCYGSAAFKVCLSDFVVMRKNATLAVAGPRVTAVAVSEQRERIGGWRVHLETTGFVDRTVDSDEEAMDEIRKFLSYMPSHCNEKPPLEFLKDDNNGDCSKILEIVPEDRAKVYDMHKVLDLVLDRESFFPVKDKFGRAVITGLGRIAGRSLGIIASNPTIKGGAPDADACDKATKFLVMCDSFNIPLVFLIDTPGFLIGDVEEKRRIAGKIMNFQQAMEMCTVPKISVILRKCYGQAFLNFGGAHSDELAVWFTAEVGFVDPAVGVNVVFGVQQDDDPEKYEELRARLAADTSAYDLAAPYYAHSVIDPRETRNYLFQVLEAVERRMTNGIGEHLLRNWPSTF